MSCEKPAGWLCCASRMERQLEWSWGKEDAGWFGACGEAVEEVEVGEGVAEDGLGL